MRFETIWTPSQKRMRAINNSFEVHEKIIHWVSSFSPASVGRKFSSIYDTRRSPQFPKVAIMGSSVNWHKFSSSVKGEKKRNLGACGALNQSLRWRFSLYFSFFFLFFFLSLAQNIFQVNFWLVYEHPFLKFLRNLIMIWGVGFPYAHTPLNHPSPNSSKIPK